MQQQIPSFETVFFSDEAHFHEFNKQNLRYWTETNVQKLHERLLHSPKVTPWCAISKLQVWGLGTLFFGAQWLHFRYSYVAVVATTNCNISS